MIWSELRVKLREKFGNEFTFYNDKYRSGKRRIKISCNRVNRDEMKQFILEQNSSLDVNEYDSLYRSCGFHICKCLTIHYSE